MGTKTIREKSIVLLLGFCWVLLTKITAANVGVSMDVALGKRHAFTLDLFLPTPSFGKGKIGDGTTEGAPFANKMVRWWREHRGARCLLGQQQPRTGACTTFLRGSAGGRCCSCVLEEHDPISILLRSSRLVC